MTSPISQRALYEKIRTAILEALRCGVDVETIHGALAQAQREVAIAEPLISAATSANERGDR